MENYAKSEEGYESILDLVAAVVDPKITLPWWPFRIADSAGDLYELSAVVGGGFGGIVESLCRAFGDASVFCVLTGPDVGDFTEAAGVYPAFRMAAKSSIEFDSHLAMAMDLGDGIWPLSEDYGLTIGGESGAWAIRGEGDWEAAIICARGMDRPWRLERPAPWNVADAVEAWIGPLQGDGSIERDNLRIFAGHSWVASS